MKASAIGRDRNAIRADRAFGTITARFTAITRAALEKAEVAILETGDDLRLRDRGNLRTIVNYGPKPRDASDLLSKSDRVLVGQTMLDPAGVLIVERRT